MRAHQHGDGRSNGRHLGELAAAVADGALPDAARERAYAHLAACPACRAEVDQQRQLKRMLSGLSAPGLSASLADRLLVVPDAEPSSDAGTAFPPGLPPVVVPASFGPRPRRTRDDSTTARSHRRAVVFGATGGLTAFMVGMTVVAAAGAQDDNEPVAPSLEAYTVEHGRSAGSLPMSDPANSIGARVAHRPGR